MNTILLSIHPKYVEKIISGEKKYEFRKTIPQKEVDRILIYATFPVMKVIGEACVDGAFLEDVNIMWNKTKRKSGVSKAFFMEYYQGKEKAYAFKLGAIKKYVRPKTLEEYGITHAPQSFMYINN